MWGVLVDSERRGFSLWNGLGLRVFVSSYSSMSFGCDGDNYTLYGFVGLLGFD